MAKDDRLYAKFTLDFPDSPKIKPLPVEAKWALVEMVCYSRRMRTDGFLSKPLAIAMWGASTCLALASNDADKPSLREVENGYLIHDFAEHQTTNAEIEALSEKRRAAGQKGGKARAKQVLEQTGGKSNPETDTEIHKTTAKAVVQQRRTGTRSKPKTHIADGFLPQQRTITAIRAEFPLATSDDLEYQTRKFRDHWAKVGKPMADWEATWRNWIRTANERGELCRATGGAKPAASDAAFARTQALKLVVPDDGRRELE